MNRNLVAATLLMSLSAPAAGQQSLYAVTHARWHVYREALSCTLYQDYGEDTTLRFSPRPDSGKLFFNAYSRAWRALDSFEGQNVTIYFWIPSLKRSMGAGAGIVRDQNGRIGIATDSFGSEMMLQWLSSERDSTIEVMMPNDEKLQLGRYSLKGGAEAVVRFADCQTEHFPQ